MPFRPLEGAFMAMSGEAHGSLIEVYPEGTGLSIASDDGQVVFTDDEPLCGARRSIFCCRLRSTMERSGGSARAGACEAPRRISGHQS